MVEILGIVVSFHHSHFLFLLVFYDSFTVRDDAMASATRQGLHAHRTPRRDCDYRDPHRVVTARRPKGTRSGCPREVPEQPQTVRDRDARLPGHVQSPACDPLRYER